jgi:hypothetical protein
VAGFQEFGIIDLELDDLGLQVASRWDADVRERDSGGIQGKRNGCADGQPSGSRAAW